MLLGNKSTRSQCRVPAIERVHCLQGCEKEVYAFGRGRYLNGAEKVLWGNGRRNWSGGESWVTQ